MQRTVVAIASVALLTILAWEGEAPAEPNSPGAGQARLGTSLAPPLAEAPPLINPAGGDGGAHGNIDEVLSQLDQVGRNLKEFSAKLKLTETDNAVGQQAIRTGSVAFQKRDGGARIHVIFDRRIDPERDRRYQEKIEYLLDGAWLIDRNYQTHSEVKRQVLKQGQKMDLFKLGEGPFPLPIGQDPAQVHRVFDIKQIPLAKGDPTGTVHLQLTPKPNTEMSRKFKLLDVWVDQKTHMPVRIDTVEQQTTRSTELQDIVVNPPGGLKESDFQLPDISDKGWNLHVESLNE